MDIKIRNKFIEIKNIKIKVTSYKFVFFYIAIVRIVLKVYFMSLHNE